MSTVSLGILGKDSGAAALFRGVGKAAREAAGDVKKAAAASKELSDAELTAKESAVALRRATMQLATAQRDLARISKDSSSTEDQRAKAALRVESAEVRHARATRTAAAASKAAAEEEENHSSALGRLATRALGGVHSMGLLSTAARGLRSTMRLAATGVASLGLALGAGAFAAGAFGLKTASNMEQAQIAFTTMFHSASKATTFLSQLQKFAASTPFEFPQLVQSSQELMAMGIRAKDVVPYLTAIGDAVAGIGGGADKIDQVTTAIGQMETKGKIQSDELLQLTEAGIPALKILADSYHVSAGKMQEMVTAGKVLSDDALPRLMKGLETGTKSTQGFGGMMAKQSQSLAGLWSTVKDTVSMSLANMITPFMPQIKASLQGFIAWSGANGPKMVAWVSANKGKIVDFGLATVQFGLRAAGAFLNTAAAGAHMVGSLLHQLGILSGDFTKMASDFVHQAAVAFGWIPGIGGKLKTADRQMKNWATSSQASLEHASQVANRTGDALSGAAARTDQMANAVGGLRTKIGQLPRSASTRITAKDAATASINAVQERLRRLDGSSATVYLTTMQRTYSTSMATTAAGAAGHRAAGGPVSAGQPYVVGEHGPELMVPATAGTIVPNSGRQASASATAGTLNITVNVHAAAAVGDRRAVVSWVRQGIREALRAEGKPAAALAI